MVAAVGDVDLVRRGVKRHPRRTIERRLTVGAVHLARRADRHEVPAVVRELQDVSVGGRRRRWCGGVAASAAGCGSRWRAASATRRGRRLILACGRNPDVAFRVDQNAADRFGPLVLTERARASPALKQLAGRIELEHDGRRDAADARARRRCRRHVQHALLVAFEGRVATVDDPHVVLRVGGHARDRSDDPRVVSERLRPQRHDTVRGRALCDDRRLIDRAGTNRDEERKTARPQVMDPLHTPPHA